MTFAIKALRAALIHDTGRLQGAENGRNLVLIIYAFMRPVAVRERDGTNRSSTGCNCSGACRRFGVARPWVQKKRSSSGIAERATKFRLRAGVPHVDKRGDSTGMLNWWRTRGRQMRLGPQRKAI
jgi:hypothetical protein